MVKELYLHLFSICLSGIQNATVVFVLHSCSVSADVMAAMTMMMPYDDVGKIDDSLGKYISFLKVERCSDRSGA